METPQERFQQILEEGIRKSLQLIIGARIPDPEIDQTDRWFCLRSEFPACLNDSDIRGFIERNNFVFNLFLKDSGKNRETILLEQWTFRCQKTAFVDTDFAKSKRHLYSKMVVFIRCLCSFLRNLPAHRLVKQSVAMKKRASLLSSFEMNFDTIENARKYQLGTSPSEFQFCSIPMHVADFSLGVKYRPFCPLSLLLQKRPQDEALNVVKDFSDDRHYHDGDGERNRIPPTPSSYPAPSPALSLSNSQSPSRQNPSSPSSQNPATKHFSSSATPKRGGGGGGGGGGGIPQQIPPPSSPVSIPSSHNKSEGAVSHSLPESRNSSVIAQSPIFVFDNYDMNSSSFQESGRKEVQGQEQQRRGGEEERDVTDKQTDDFFRTSTHETEDQTTTESPSMAGSLESTKSPPFFMAPKVPPIELLGSPPTTSSPSFFPKYFSPFKVGPKTSAFLNTEVSSFPPPPSFYCFSKETFPTQNIIITPTPL